MQVFHPGVTMTARTFAFTAIAFVGAFTVAGATAQRDAQPASLAQFNAATHQYAQLHRQIERQLPPFRAHSDAQDIFESSNAMASALQTARAGAREGDIFTRDVAAVIRARVAAALTAHGFLPEEVVAATLEETDDEAPLPVVNGRFPWRRGAAMWPCVLDALPSLPNELQYRLVGRDLVLVDTHADLIVDILRNAVR
jgi:hypothetical protein